MARSKVKKRSKENLDHRVAAVLGASPRTVARVTCVFLEEIALELVRTGSVTLPRVGRLRVNHEQSRPAQLARAPGASTRKVEANKSLKVYFSRSDYLRDALNRKHRR
jgi:nucleoid DNA-binding protein